MREKLSVSGADIGEGASARGDFTLIKPYAEMGMSSGEIRDALRIEHGISAHPRSIGIVLDKERQSGELRHLTREEYEDIQKDQNSQSERRDRAQSVFRWLLTKTVLMANNEILPEKRISLPSSRLEWKDAIKKLGEDGRLGDIIITTKPLILRKTPVTDVVKIYNACNNNVWGAGAMSDEEKSIQFVARCLGGGLISNDLSTWKSLHPLFIAFNKELSVGFSEKVRLEVFLAARRDAERGDTRLITKYKRIGEEIDADWFDNSLNKEEDFIAETIVPSSYGYDELGYYRLDSEGGVWREVDGIDDNGHIRYIGSTRHTYKVGSPEIMEMEERGKKPREPRVQPKSKSPYSSLA